MNLTRCVHRRRWPGILTVVFAGMLLVGLFFGAPGRVTGTKTVAFAAGSESTPAPDFELKDLSGAPVKMSAFKDQKPVLVYFWATWCPYCLKAKPKIAEMRKENPEKDLAIIGVNVGGADSLERLKRYQEMNPVQWPILYDKDGSVSRNYHVQGIPLFVLVNKAGNIVYIGNSLPDPKEYLKK
jgi:thiol-disulfide isomerase/thioredoxin